MSFKSGFVSIVGNPNVGKSTLFNSLIKDDISVVTNKSQTTRDCIKGILTTKDYQIILLDTPGHVESSYSLHDKMNRNIFSSLDGVDLVLYVTDVREKLINNELIDVVLRKNIPIILVVNKKDLNDKFDLTNIEEPFENKILISSRNTMDIEKIKNLILKNLPTHPPYYEKNDLTDKSERFLISEIIRGEIFKNFSKEVPYSTFIEIFLFKNLNRLLKIEGHVITESESQKKILIGKKGNMIRKFSESSRIIIEKKYQKKVYINLTIKVKKWRNDMNFVNNKF